MLQFFRNNTKIVIWFTILLLVGVFGLSSISLRKHDQYAGEVFGKKVSFQEFRTFETLTRLLRPSASDKSMDDPNISYQFTWQQLALSREAQNQKIQVTDEEVRLRVDLLINGNGSNRASRSEYLNLLKTWRTTPHEFEGGIRELLRIQKMIANRFPPRTEPAQISTVNPAEIKKLAETSEAEQNKKKQEYMEWISDLFRKAKITDYSLAQKNSTVPASETEPPADSLNSETAPDKSPSEEPNEKP